MAVDLTKLEQFVHRFAGDIGAVFHASTVLIGDRLGLYRAMADSQWVTAAELADRTGTDERYVTEWLAAQAASQYAEYDAPSGRYRLSEEQAFALTDEMHPVFAPGGVECAASTIHDVDRMVEAYRSGAGVPWGEHHHLLFEGTMRFFRANYIGALVDSWLPALDGVVDRLGAGGARVADVGCGLGSSTVLMAAAFPDAVLTGFDVHEDSVAAARKAAAEAGVADRCKFEVASAKDFPGTAYDLITYFDCLHDMGDPVGALAHGREALADGGTVMVVEPYAGDSVADNLNPVGRIYYSASSTLCVPNSRSQEGDAALGAQAGEVRIREVAASAGLGHFRRAAETPFNLVYEARP